MIRKLRRQLTALLTVVLSLVLIFILTATYWTAYRSELQESYALLAKAAERFEQQPDNRGGQAPHGDGQGLGQDLSDLLSAARFYYVSYDQAETGTVTGNETDGYTSEELLEYAAAAKESGDETGKSDNGNLLYQIQKDPDGETVVFLDNSRTNWQLQKQGMISLAFAVGGTLVIFFASLLLTRKITKPVEETLEQQKTFISDASHELKTPLAVIQANADTLEGEIGTNKWLGYIRSEADRMNQLVTSLLSLARAEDEMARREHLPFDLSAAVEYSGMVFESVAYEKGVTLTIQAEPGIELTGSENRIRQLLSILLDNAVKHTQPGGSVVAGVRREKKKLRLWVSNTGEEIPREEREKIFRRFYRGDQARDRSQGRYGLGLAIARAVAEEHKGTISVDCADGITTFTVLF